MQVEPCQNCAMFDKHSSHCMKFNMPVADQLKSGCSWHRSNLPLCDFCHRAIAPGIQSLVFLEGEEYKTVCPECYQKIDWSDKK